jgi:HSP20 family protein
MLLTRLRPLAWPDLGDMAWLPFLEPVIRIEAHRKENVYFVRAEIPGIDPAKDVEITADDGYLRLTVVRQDPSEHEQDARSEFRYGTFHRTIALPPGAKEESISAKYNDGILEITMKVGEPVHVSKTIPIAIGNGQPKPAKKA